jgi:hypothetical protein
MSNWNEQDLALFERMRAAVKKGYYLHGKEVTDLYNRVLNKNLAATSCASCIRQRYNELRKYYDIYQSKNSITVVEEIPFDADAKNDAEAKPVEETPKPKVAKKTTAKKITKTTTKKKK